MSATQKLALLSVILGGITGLLVLGAAAVVKHPTKGRFWLGGTAWGIIVCVLMLTDCLHQRGPGPVSDAAIPLFFAGLFLWPAAMTWRQSKWGVKWPLAQLVMLLTIGPAFFAAVIAAMCIMT